MTKSNIYLDYASGVKANPSSIHSLGIKAKSDLEEARQNTALVLNAKSSEIIFNKRSPNKPAFSIPTFTDNLFFIRLRLLSVLYSNRISMSWVGTSSR